MENPLTMRIRPGGPPPTLREVEAADGYATVRRALREMAPDHVVKLVKESGLRGRGGAGFPTGQKWGFFVHGEGARRPAYLVVNGDEMEPGTFKDRLLMEGDPHQLVEGVILSAYAIRADHAYIFLRAEYTEAERRLARAVREAEDAGYVGKNILGTGWNLEVHVHVSAGRYLCGEETALLNSLEGKRAIPRAKPPYPGIAGFFGQPTVVNNVETLCNVPHIVARGPAWFKALSKTGDGGTKIFGASGKVKRPGAWELPMGTTIREILEEHAGGMRDGLALRGLLPGGASTDFLGPESLDVPMDFDSVQAVGSRMGTGMLIVLDDKTCPVGMVASLMRFFAQESCGWCTPCRDGLATLSRTLDAIERGEGREGDLEVLDRHSRFLGPGMTFCAHAPGAMEPLRSALKLFRDDFARHVREKRCPWRT